MVMRVARLKRTRHQSTPILSLIRKRKERKKYLGTKIEKAFLINLETIGNQFLMVTKVHMILIGMCNIQMELILQSIHQSNKTKDFFNE